MKYGDDVGDVFGIDVSGWVEQHRSRDLYEVAREQEDSRDDLEPGQVLDFILPIWRVGECLLHAKRLSNELCDEPPDVAVDVWWTGLDGRNLASIENRRGIFPPVEHQAHQDTVSVTHVFAVEELEDTLPEVVDHLTQPFYQAFDFFDPSSQLIQKELDRMQGR